MIDLRCGDCLDRMKELEDCSVDLILTDPPYELNFMSKKWDNTGIAFDKKVWEEAFRVLKPGGYLMAFSSTRTYHKMATAIEEAGFEIKDIIEWVYGSGFPKSLDISKALDKKGQEDLAKQYKGYKSHLKPAHEPICLALKPTYKTFADNIVKWEVGGLNIDGARIGSETININGGGKKWRNNGEKIEYVKAINETRDGRYPANFIIDKNITHILDNQSGFSRSRTTVRNESVSYKKDVLSLGITTRFGSKHTDQGGASRYFYKTDIEEDTYIPFCYTAKASKRERNTDINGAVHTKLNNHTTVKPKSILKYLLQLGLPPHNSVVLDMFAGSGSLGLAIEETNKETEKQHTAILIEKDEAHCNIIKERCCL